MGGTAGQADVAPRRGLHARPVPADGRGQARGRPRRATARSRLDRTATCRRRSWGSAAPCWGDGRQPGHRRPASTSLQLRHALAEWVATPRRSRWVSGARWAHRSTPSRSSRWSTSWHGRRGRTHFSSAGTLTDPRWMAVLDAAATLGGWCTPLPAGRSRGIAIGTAFNSIVARLSRSRSRHRALFQRDQVAVALDCYCSVNPGQVEAQLVGGMVHGLNAALYGRQTFANGAAQRRTSTARMIRLQRDADGVRHDHPAAGGGRPRGPIGGVGELGVPTFAPALANAVARLAAAAGCARCRSSRTRRWAACNWVVVPRRSIRQRRGECLVSPFGFPRRPSC